MSAGPQDTASRPPIMLDACATLNLYATACMAEILCSLGERFAITQTVKREALWVLRGVEGDDASEREAVDLEPLLQAGLLEVVDLEAEEEMATFVGFAALVDDGEAATIALAIHRGGAVATDDRKAIRELRARAPGIEIWTTARILRAWADSTSASPMRVATVLRAVRVRARFEPNRQDPLFSWWTSHQESGQPPP